MEERICANCGFDIEEDEEYHVTEDGSILCDNCFDTLYGICYMCEKITLIDDLEYWGDVLLCPKCMKEQCPDFDEEDNEEEVEAAYQAMLKKYIGRKSWKYEEGAHHLEYVDNDGETEKRYSVSIKVDKDGRIVDISRLQAMILLSESITTSNWKPYPIEDFDYEFVIEDLLDDYLEDD